MGKGRVGKSAVAVEVVVEAFMVVVVVVVVVSVVAVCVLVIMVNGVVNEASTRTKPVMIRVTETNKTVA